MANWLTHILWGSVISDKLTQNRKLILGGMILAILLDIDYIVPLTYHRGFIHTPFIAFLIAGAVYVFTRSKEHAIMVLAVLMSHLILDTIASSEPVMWLWPLSTHPIGGIMTFSHRITIKIILLTIPIVWIAHLQRTGQEPFKILDSVPKKILALSLILVAIDSALRVYSHWQDSLLCCP